MTTFHVRAGAKGSGRAADDALGTLGAAVAKAQAGDRVVVSGVFREQLRCPAGVVWEAAEGEEAIIDGGWDGRSKGKNNAFLIGIGQPDVALRGLTIRNCPGQGIHVGAGGDRATIDGCAIQNCYDGAFVLSGEGQFVEDVRLLNTVMTDLSLSWRFDTRGVGGCCRWRYAKRGLVQNCVVGRGHGEGIAAGVGTVGMEIIGNVVFDLMHLAIYAGNNATDVVVEDNIIFHTGDERFMHDGKAGRGIVTGNEIRPRDNIDDRWPKADRIRIRRNLVVGTGSFIGIANGGKMKGDDDDPVWDGYITNTTDYVAEHNTFVATKNTRFGIMFQEATQGEPIRGVFRDNVILYDNAPDKGRQLVAAKGIVMSGNRWSVRPERMAAGDEAIEARALMAPLAEIAGDVDAASFPVDNYRPRDGGPLVMEGKAVAGALQPIGVEPPPPPPPAGPDWEAILARVAALGVQLDTQAEALATAALANSAAQEERDALVELIEQYSE